jgi:hypothetical protein
MTVKRRILCRAGTVLLLFMLAGCPFRDNPPDTPSAPTGPTLVYRESTAAYSASATDPDRDSVYLGFDYDSGNGYYNESATWSRLVASGDTVSVEFHWWYAGTYKLRVRALDVHGYYSDWSQWLTITVR